MIITLHSNLHCGNKFYLLAQLSSGNTEYL